MRTRLSASVGTILIFLVMVFAGSFGAGVGRSVPGQVQQADADSLERTVRYLEYDQLSLEYRTRYCLREDETFEIAEYLAGRLEGYTGSTPVLDPFEIVRIFGSGDTTFTTYNIIADADLCAGCDDVLIIAAHYDATAVRTSGFSSSWDTYAAPGANDNGTGVAALMEAARVLCAEQHPFDIRFILFSGEELGRLGSIDYVEKCDLDPSCVDNILGVVNLDMLGYTAGARGISIMSDEYSGWLAYALAAAAARIEPSLEIDIIKPGPWNWDHASFWEKDGSPVSAITLAEPLEDDGGIIYPEYHTVDDTLGNIDFQQVEMITGVLIGFVQEMSSAPPEFTMFDTDIVFYVDGIEQPLKEFDADDEVEVHVKVRNIGGYPSGTEDITLTIVHEDSDGHDLISLDTVLIPEILETTDVVFTLPERAMGAGGHILRASIRVVSSGDDPDNDSALASYSVAGQSGGLLSHNFRPNPVRGSFSEAMFCINLEREADLAIDLFDMEGELIAKRSLGRRYGDPLEAGNTCIRCGDLFNGVDDLVSGIYIYRIRLIGSDGSKSDHHGRFAIVR